MLRRLNWQRVLSGQAGLLAIGVGKPVDRGRSTRSWRPLVAPWRFELEGSYWIPDWEFVELDCFRFVMTLNGFLTIPQRQCWRVFLSNDLRAVCHMAFVPDLIFSAGPIQIDHEKQAGGSQQRSTCIETS